MFAASCGVSNPGPRAADLSVTQLQCWIWTMHKNGLSWICYLTLYLSWKMIPPTREIKIVFWKNKYSFGWDDRCESFENKVAVDSMMPKVMLKPSGGVTVTAQCHFSASSSKYCVIFSVSLCNSFVFCFVFGLMRPMGANYCIFTQSAETHKNRVIKKNKEEGESVNQISFQALLSVFLQLSSPPSGLIDCLSKLSQTTSIPHTHTLVCTDQPQTESRALLIQHDLSCAHHWVHHCANRPRRLPARCCAWHSRKPLMRRACCWK